MQTFLPYKDYKLSAEVLDDKRIGNQVYRECKTIVNGGWSNHPASKMWKGFEFELCNYSLALLEELKKRGRYYPLHIEFFKEKQKTFKNTGIPPWLGNEKFHASHRSNLLRKDKEHYSKFGWKEADNLPYFWPV